jgi:hypothetical protein
VSSGFGDTPATLFEKCLRSKKLGTAMLYLPLIEPHLLTPPTPNEPATPERRNSERVRPCHHACAHGSQAGRGQTLRSMGPGPACLNS